MNKRIYLIAAFWGIFSAYQLQAQCNLVIDSVSYSDISCFGASDGQITVYASGNNGAIVYSNGSGDSALVPEVQFNSAVELSTAGGSGPTDKWWSPSSCSSGAYFQYSSQVGCPAGSAEFKGGFSGYAGCFLRSPKVNMNGVDMATITMDVSNAFTASKPNDHLRFYVWVDNGYKSTASLFTINGVSGNKLNFDKARDCEEITVTFDLSGIGANNRNDFMFYIESNCAYSNCSAYQVSVDNIQFSKGGSYQISETFSGLSAGSYPITIKDASGCIARLSNPILIQEPAELVPEISLDGATLSTGIYASYQWYRDGELLEGGTEQTYTISGNGDYTVEVNDSNGCDGTSEPFQVLTTGLFNKHTDSRMEIAPNPFSDQIKLSWAEKASRSVVVMASTGQVLLSTHTGETHLQLPAELFVPGLYLVQVVESGRIYSRLILKSAY